MAERLGGGQILLNIRRHKLKMTKNFSGGGGGVSVLRRALVQCDCSMKKILMKVFNPLNLPSNKRSTARILMGANVPLL